VLRVTTTAIITDCAIMGGDSGGPLFDLEGRVIAVSSRCDNSLVANLHVPVDQYRTNWERLAKGEDFNSRAPSLAYLGIMHDQVSEEPRIGVVFPETAAAKAGLRVGDVLVRFGGKALEKYDQLIDFLRDRKPGDEVEIEVRRGDQTVTLKAKLDKRRD
jgi:serine protease Do